MGKKQKNKLLLIIILLLIALSLGKMAMDFYKKHEPHPLGDNSKVTYLGMREYGCVTLCGSGPGETYAYGTDLTPPELVKYFKNAKVTQPDKAKNWKKQEPRFTLDFHNRTSKDYFFINFYTQGDKEASSLNFDLQNTYLLEIDGDFYNTAKNSL